MVTEWQATLAIQLAGACFSAGVLWATVRYLRSELKDLKDWRQAQTEETTQMREDIAGLKIHTDYPG